MSYVDKNANRRFRRLIEHANREGGGSDRCHGCGRQLRSGEATLLGTDRRGVMLVVANCCPCRIEIIYGIGFYIAARDAPPEWLAAVEPQGRA